jgi:hypothetical protein
VGAAGALLNERFGPPLLLGRRLATRLPDALSGLNIAGGAVYDALVALAAKEHGCELATRDGRAKATYEAVGVRVIVVEQSRLERNRLNFRIVGMGGPLTDEVSAYPWT